MNIKNIISIMAAAGLLLTLPLHAHADGERTAKKKTAKAPTRLYGEGEFIKLFSNRTRQQVADVLGKPESTGQGRVLSQEESSMATMVQPGEKSKTNDSVEMWYYRHIVRYAPKRTFDKVELTFVNDRCQNVAYFNDKR